MSLFGDLPPTQKDIPVTNTSYIQASNAADAGSQSSAENTSNSSLTLLDLDNQNSRNRTSNTGVTGEGNVPCSTPTAIIKPQISQTTQNPSQVGTKRSSTDEPVSPGAKRIAIGLSILHGYVAERKGERADMQDAHVLLDDCTSHFPQFKDSVRRVAYYAVFDGHGGHRASRHCAKRLHQHLIQNLPKSDVNNFPKEMKKMILQSFKNVDEEFLREASLQKPVWKDGTTACCVLIMDDSMYIMNLGDSKAILCRYNAEHKKHASISLSKEHNPTDYDERQRIQKAGGQVREGRIMGILEVSRSIGDGQYKRCGVINVPDVKRCSITSNDRFLLIACDGLWKVYSPEQAIEFVLHVLQDNTIQIPEGSMKTLEETRFDVACNRLASEAVRKGSADNVTVLLVSVRKL